MGKLLGPDLKSLKAVLACKIYPLAYIFFSVTCYERQGCSSSGLVFPDITTQECCDNVNGGGLGGIGLGVSFTRDGIECTPCPIG